MDYFIVLWKYDFYLLFLHDVQYQYLFFVFRLPKIVYRVADITL